jgi:hypothetical protein
MHGIMKIKDGIVGSLGSASVPMIEGDFFHFHRNFFDDLFLISIMILTGVISSITVAFLRECRAKYRASRLKKYKFKN